MQKKFPKKIGLIANTNILAIIFLMLSSLAWAGGPRALPLLNQTKWNSTDRLIVKLRDQQVTGMSINSAQVHSLSTAAGVSLSHFRAMSGDAQVMQLPRRMSLAEVEVIARLLSSDPLVEYAEPDRVMHPLLFPNDVEYVNQWHYHSHVAQVPYLAVAGGANLPGAWDLTTGSTSVVVAVIDTGLVPHADIDDNILDSSGKVVSGYDFVSQDASGIFYTANDGDGRDSDPRDPGDWITLDEDEGTDITGGFFAGCGASDSSWHGTHVAGTIGAFSNNTTGVSGVNWTSRILPVRVLGKCGGYLSDVVDGMRWAAGLSVSGVSANPNPAKVLNLSLGGPGSCSSTEQRAINAIVAAGSVVVVAAGNSGVDLEQSPESPANCLNVVSVAAVKRNGGRALYSNYGTTVEIAAPGGDRSVINSDGVLSTLNTGTTTPVASPGGDAYVYYQGTSMAAPHVAGIVSLVVSANPALTPASVLSILQSTARTFPTGTGSDCTTSTCGAGIVNAATAVEVASTIVTVAATDSTAAETGLSPGTFTINRTGPATGDLTVSYTMSGTAANGVDYTTLSGSVIIASGSTTATVTLTPIDDTGYEGTQTAIMTLTASPSTYSVGSPASATVSIADDDSPPPSFGGGGGGCFIATAAYGTPMAEDVRYLRAFRDEYLQTNDAGRWFVKHYYKYSPSFADYLREHDSLRGMVRTALSPLVAVSKGLVSEETLATQTKDRP